MRPALLVVLLFLGACAAPPGTIGPAQPSLVPYATWTPGTVPSGLDGLVTAEMPLASPTPFTYTVQPGDTMGGIALKFGVALADLEAANPGVLPNTMSIGEVLRIPSDPANPSGEPTPTPAPLRVERIDCHPKVDQGMWCFVLIRNDASDFLENVSAQITLVGPQGDILVSQPALLPLNILPPAMSLPLAAFFNPIIPVDAEPRVQILTAVRLEPSDPRYLPASTRNVLVQIDWDGRRAVVSGSVALPAKSRAAASVWLAATAYDTSGRVVGWRRWEGGPLQPGGTLPFTFTVSSLGGRIDRVELAIEARP